MSTIQEPIPQVMKAEEAYDQIAPLYDERPWSKFWMKHELPIIKDKLTHQRFTRFLDAGCGTSPYLSILNKHIKEYYGLDISEGMLEEAIRKYSNINLSSQASWSKASLTEIPFEDNYFSAILCTRVLSHFTDWKQVLVEFYRTLEPGGLCLITDIHPEHHYEMTGFRTFKRKIYVETFKHENFINTVESFKKMPEFFIHIEEKSFIIKDFQEFSMRNIIQDRYDDQLKELYTELDDLYLYQHDKIFYFMLIQKPY
ncbi:MAG: class I SAM-dependent methyltransferase [Microscillaceae bacterium]|nr:class I SAM-dependent methyltransferase [Microscillaceae bacterium]